ncbi:hypothetical protein [uncultured Tateyamaria sp.]|uniref:hypothetical protein n=1 Tax=uncultured Tateyamaria sp. TaxID=455651 RepID=UPI00260D701C|nr:hypothetical protein [uncultured Tateyamaria sp.]
MSTPQSDQSHATGAQWTAVCALLLAAFVTLLDVTVVNLAVPSIAADLQATEYYHCTRVVAARGTCMRLLPSQYENTPSEKFDHNSHKFRMNF